MWNGGRSAVGNRQPSKKSFHLSVVRIRIIDYIEWQMAVHPYYVVHSYFLNGLFT